MQYGTTGKEAVALAFMEAVSKDAEKKFNELSASEGYPAAKFRIFCSMKLGPSEDECFSMLRAQGKGSQILSGESVVD